MYIQSSGLGLGLSTALYVNNETIILAEDVVERFYTVSDVAILITIVYPGKCVVPEAAILFCVLENMLSLNRSRR